MIEYKIPSIVETLPADFEYKSVTDRYFSRRYCLNVKGIDNNDIQLLFHSNRICLITLAPSHFFFKNKNNFHINFCPGEVDRTKNKVKGKGKKGGQLLEENSKICSINFDDGLSFILTSCMKGRLIEVNEQLIDNPMLLREETDSRGYVAVVLSNIEVSQLRKDELLTHEDYIKLFPDS